MSEPFLGEIRPFGFNFNPRGWAFCNGQLQAINSNEALFSLLGTIYGGDGRTTFGLPDLRGRFPTHFGTGPGLTPLSIGQKGGAETHTMTTSEMPSHNHTATAHNHKAPGSSSNPNGRFWAVDDTGEKMYSDGPSDGQMNAAAVTMSHTGGGQAFNIKAPFLTINFCISLVGVFPSRS